jgi:hypothetical protein
MALCKNAVSQKSLTLQNSKIALKISICMKSEAFLPYFLISKIEGFELWIRNFYHKCVLLFSNLAAQLKSQSKIVRYDLFIWNHRKNQTKFINKFRRC